MNIKDAFRYQAFLEQRFNDASYFVSDKSHAFFITKKHLLSKANPEAEDKTEENVIAEESFRNDDVIALMSEMIDQREILGKAISKAKANIAFDIDSAISSNKFRRNAVRSIKSMLSSRAHSRKEKGSDYKFNADGNQVPYFYDVEVDYVEAFDRVEDKKLSRKLSVLADKISADVDSVMTNTQVDYDTPFDVNGSFEDVMNEFLSNRADV